jgi:ABC-type transport system substrate-binding protein
MEMIMANVFVSILHKIGHDAVAVSDYLLTDAVKYLPLAETLAGFIFPPAVAPLAEANAAADLLQKAVAAAEIQLASAGLKGDVGPQKLATVLSIVTGAVTTLLGTPAIANDLSKAGIKVNTPYITSLVNAVVSFLSVQGVVSTTAPTPNAAAAV